MANIIGTVGNDLLNGDVNASNTIDGLQGDDTINGGYFNDTLNGGDGNDQINDSG
jgi:Ca2+-binding RTX toxin-like protein